MLTPIQKLNLYGALLLAGLVLTFALASIFRPDAIDATAGHDRYGAARVVGGGL